MQQKNKEDFVGKIVTLKQDFLVKARKKDSGVPTKDGRPYLIVDIPTGENSTQLFAIPMQTSVNKKIGESFFEGLVDRLEVRKDNRSGLLFSQMIPITLGQIFGRKTYENKTPVGSEKRKIAINNIKKLDLESVSEKARPSLKYLKEHGVNEFSFCNKDFCSSYKIVSGDILKQTIKIKDQKLELINRKALNYLNLYIEYSKQEKLRAKGLVIDKSKRIRLPENFTNIKELLVFLERYSGEKIIHKGKTVSAETVKTYLQSYEKKETKELTPKQIEIAKNLSDRTGKPVDRVTKVFEYIHNNGIFAPKEPVASKQKVIVKTQEKNNSQQPASAKPKKKDSDYNCR